VRYWIASLRWRGSMLSAASRSAIVRATFRIRSCARAESPSRVIAFSSNFLAFWSDCAVFANHFGHHLRVGVRSFIGVVALRLPVTRVDHPLAHCRGIFRRGGRPQLLILYGGNLDVNVDPVEQRAGNLGDVTLNHRRSTVALARRVGKIAARTRIHGGCQHEARGESYRNCGARYRDGTILNWLTS
jgi:hypothetical protein